MECGKNAASAAIERLQTNYSLTILQFLKTVSTLNAKIVDLLARKRKNKEEIWQRELLVHNAAEKKRKKNSS